MSSFSINADFDRNGTVDARAAERNARDKFPGAILIPNLDNWRPCDTVESAAAWGARTWPANRS